jgi:hypothetical protein
MEDSVRLHRLEPPIYHPVSASSLYKHAHAHQPVHVWMLYATLIGLSLGGASALQLAARPILGDSARARPATMVESWYDAGTRLADDEPQQAMFCNETGCWIGEPPPITLPDGRKMNVCNDVGVELGAVVPTKRRPAEVGVFAPIVKGTKRVMGEKELNKLRADVIAQHTKVISAFVDTSESPFGQIVLSRLFEAADKDGNGTLDREEVRDALHALGFKFIEDKQLDQIFARGDTDDNQVIDFEEFVKETPKTLRSSLIKLAKVNGHDLGFLA